MFERILVAMDRSELAQKALKKAVKLAKLANSEIYIVTVIQKKTPHNFAEAEKILNDAEEYAASQGLEAKTFVKVGEPPDEIVFLAVHEKVELIVLGERGETGVRRLLLGSTAQETIRFAKCSVLVVK
ncbi:MAG: universal stress protein [Euryarchaeota archaeon]|nr:universal stress protein [Euryarchaeota archaeon]